LNTFGLNDRLFKDVTELMDRGLPKPIDWDEVDSILKEERERSMDWIKKALLDNYKK